MPVTKRNSREIAEEVEAQRARLDGRLDALRQQMSFRSVADELARRTGLDEAGLPQRLSRNPLALGMATAGIAWLVLGRGDSKAPPPARRRATATHPHKDITDMDHRIDRPAEPAFGDNAFGRLFERDPLVVGAIAVALGAAIGAALPSSRREDRLLGDFHDDAADTVRSTARRVRHEVADAARETVRAAGRAAREEGLTPSSSRGGPTIAKKVENVARRTEQEAERQAGLRPDVEGSPATRDEILR